MIIPIRCFSCGKPIAQLWEEYKKRAESGEDKKKLLDELGLDRYCCRRTIFSHVDLMDEVMKYNV